MSTFDRKEGINWTAISVIALLLLNLLAAAYSYGIMSNKVDNLKENQIQLGTDIKGVRNLIENHILSSVPSNKDGKQNDNQQAR